MRGIVAFLERRESSLHEQRQQAQRAQLIRRRDDNPAAGPDDARQLADERARILQVLDHLDGRGDVDARVGERQPLTIEIGLQKRHVGGSPS